jgi:hypothetical protein
MARFIREPLEVCVSPGADIMCGDCELLAFSRRRPGRPSRNCRAAVFCRKGIYGYRVGRRGSKMSGRLPRPDSRTQALPWEYARLWWSDSLLWREPAWATCSWWKCHRDSIQKRCPDVDMYKVRCACCGLHGGRWEVFTVRTGLIVSFILSIASPSEIGPRHHF